MMQPNYLPWAGFFNLIYNSDFFVFLDDVQFSKNSFGNRNQYLTKSGSAYITLPVRKLKLEQTYRDTFVVEESKWRKKHLSTIKSVYAKHPYFNEFFPKLEMIITNTNYKNLADIYSNLIIHICKYIGIEKNFVFSSELKKRPQRSERIYDICQNLGCSVLLSAKGSRGYMEEDLFFDRFDDLQVHFQNFKAREYCQKNSIKFVDKLSIIDVIFNLGPKLTHQYVSCEIT